MGLYKGNADGTFEKIAGLDTDTSFICSTDSTESSVPFSDYLIVFQDRITVSYGSIKKNGQHYQMHVKFTLNTTYTQDWKTTLQGTDLFNALCRIAHGVAYNTSDSGIYGMQAFYDGGSVRLFPIVEITQTGTTWELVMSWMN